MDIAEDGLPKLVITKEDMEAGLSLARTFPGFFPRTQGDCNFAARLAGRERQLRELVAPRDKANAVVDSEKEDGPKTFVEHLAYAFAWYEMLHRFTGQALIDECDRIWRRFIPETTDVVNRWMNRGIYPRIAGNPDPLLHAAENLFALVSALCLKELTSDGLLHVKLALSVMQMNGSTMEMPAPFDQEKGPPPKRPDDIPLRRS